MITRSNRHTRTNPCPICGGYDEQDRGEGVRCGGWNKEGYVHCSRQDSPEVDPTGLYVHFMHGPCRCGTQHGPTTGVRARSIDIEAVYTYVDEQGDLLFEVIRKPGKQFRQRKPDGDGKWIWKLNGVRKVLYRLPELLAAGNEVTVYVAEGEKDVDNLRKAGHVATCNPGGAGKWKHVSDLARLVLKDHSVIVISDNDDQGRKHAREVAASLVDVCQVRVMQAPEPFKDVSDMLAAGMSLEGLVPFVDPTPSLPAAPPKQPPIPPPPPPASEFPSRNDDDGATGLHTEMRNAERLIEWYGQDIRYCATWSKWLAWDGMRWCLDDAGRVHWFAVETARRMLKMALDEHKKAGDEVQNAAGEEDRAKKMNALQKTLADVRHASKSQSSSSLNSTVAIARYNPAIVVHHSQLDAHPMLLNVENGTIDLSTGALREHKREDLITKVAPVEYNPIASCPTWLTFISQVMNNDASLVEFLKRICGYTLTGDVREHALFFFHGGGSNGKSTFLGTIHSMLGDYAMPAARHLLFKKGFDQHPTSLATLCGRRFITCSEIGEGQAFDEPLVKDLTGGDPINTHRMREDEWSFMPTHKLFISGQHKPIVRGDDDGIWRRMRLVPWTVSFLGKEDKSLSEKLRAELPGILAWAVDGCASWLAHGLDAPVNVKAATQAYRNENDSLAEFFRLAVVFEPLARIPRSHLRLAYEVHCRENGIEPLGARRFSGRLREYGSKLLEDGVREVPVRVVGTDARSHVQNGWAGVRLKTQDEQAKSLLEAESALAGKKVSVGTA